MLDEVRVGRLPDASTTPARAELGYTSRPAAEALAQAARSALAEHAPTAAAVCDPSGGDAGGAEDLDAVLSGQPGHGLDLGGSVAGGGVASSVAGSARVRMNSSNQLDGHPSGIWPSRS